jgi:hypothetical protein
MDINAEYVGEVKQEGRKMRTTRGPGYTTLKTVVRLWVTESSTMSNLPSLTKPLAEADRPREWEALRADKIEVTWGYWYRGDDDNAKCAFGIEVTYEDRGHAARAAEGRKVLARLRKDGIETAFVTALTRDAFEAAAKSHAAEEAARKLGWMAAGIVSEAGRRAREEMDYDKRAERLRTVLANHTENFAIDFVSEVAREHGVDEADLKLAVEELLSRPSYYLASI